ncbi:MAG: TOBE domain-containing protein, partial [Steroidobacteraceae bacterium]
GTPAAIYESPATKFVADFIGSVNRFEGRVAEAGTGRIQSDELGCVIAVNRNLNCAGGATVWTAVRPEKINMSRTLDDEHPLRENVARGTVREIAYMGEVSIYLVQIDSGKIVRVSLPNIMRDAEHRITRDETVYLSWHGSSPVVLTE